MSGTNLVHESHFSDGERHGHEFDPEKKSQVYLGYLFLRAGKNMFTPLGTFSEAEINFEDFMQRKGNKPGQTHQCLEYGYWTCERTDQTQYHLKGVL